MLKKKTKGNSPRHYTAWFDYDDRVGPRAKSRQKLVRGLEFVAPSDRTAASVLPYLAMRVAQSLGWRVLLSDLCEITSKYSTCQVWESGQVARRPRSKKP